MAPANTKRSATIHHRKRTGQHHKRGKHYHKVYWPYVASLLIVAMGLFAANWQPHTRNGVLAYATEMSIDKLLVATNEQRAKDGKKPLTLNTKLNTAAQNKANDMTQRNYWSHNTPDGEEPWIFIQAVDYEYLKAGENLAYGFNSSEQTIRGWMNSKTHRDNMLDNNYTEVGFGFANHKDFNNSGPETVVVAMYGLPSDAPIPSNINEEKTKNTNVVTSTNPLTKEPSSQGISRIQTLTGGNMPWVTFAVGLTSGLLVAFVVIKHGVALRRFAVEGEEFFIHHPILDVTIVALVMLGYFLLQGNAVIK